MNVLINSCSERKKNKALTASTSTLTPSKTLTMVVENESSVDVTCDVSKALIPLVPLDFEEVFQVKEMIDAGGDKVTSGERVKGIDDPAIGAERATKGAAITEVPRKGRHHRRGSSKQRPLRLLRRSPEGRKGEGKTMRRRKRQFRSCETPNFFLAR